LTFINLGDNSLDYTVHGTRTASIYSEGWPVEWEVVADGSVAGGAIANVIVDKKWWALRIFSKRTTKGSGSQWKIIVTLVRK